jgi:hypothetical protein
MSNNIKNGSLYVFQNEEAIDVVEIFLDDPRNINLASRAKKNVKINEFQPIMLLEYWEHTKIYTEEYFLIRFFTSGGHISYSLFWNKEEFMEKFKLATKEQ